MQLHFTPANPPGAGGRLQRSAMVDRLSARHYGRVTPYAASGFLRAKLEHEA